jgi:MFS family permease
VLGMHRFPLLRQVPDGPALMLAAVLVAPGLSAVDVVVLLALHRTTGSFAAAGGAVAVLTVSGALVNLVQGRWVDRTGSLRPLLTCAGIALLAAGGLLVALGLGWPTLGLLALVALLGAALPATQPALRGLWVARTEDGELRDTALAFVSLTQDAGYLAGPAGFGALAELISPAVALVLCVASIGLGTLAAGRVRMLRAESSVALPPGGQSVLRSLAGLAGTMVLLGGALGGIDVAAATFAVQHGAPSLAGAMIGACSIGGLAGGVGYGARHWRAVSSRRLAVAAGCTAAGFVLPALAPNLALGAIALALVGAPLSVTLVVAYGWAAEIVPSERRTEAFTGLGLALNLGVALGNAAGGALCGSASASAGFWFAGGCALACGFAATLAGHSQPSQGEQAA